PIKSGYGFMVISTPDGVLAGGEARREKVGGELLFEIW
ncbi:30S ribosomal protein S8, partial [Candidatus Wolfebacteria bacterium]|nr:30S ribosomal protein S8 [Candidatus Wolfebacteria bacterium]